MDIYMAYLNPKAFTYLGHLAGPALDEARNQLVAKRTAHRGIFNKLLAANVEYLERIHFVASGKLFLCAYNFGMIRNSFQAATTTAYLHSSASLPMSSGTHLGLPLAAPNSLILFQIGGQSGKKV